MKQLKRYAAVLLLLATWEAQVVGQRPTYQNRWVYVTRNLAEDRHVEEIRQLARIAAQHGLNGIVLARAPDQILAPPAGYLRRLREVKEICSRHSLELIPSMFSVGYGTAALRQNRNLAEGFPVKDALYVVSGREAQFVSDPKVGFVNGGFEQRQGNQLTGYIVQDQPRKMIFIDREVFHWGGASLRFEHFGDYKHGQAHVIQEVAVAPFRSYRLIAWVKVENLDPAESFVIHVLAPDGRTLGPTDPRSPRAAGWVKVILGFNSGRYDKVIVRVGLRGGKLGKLWVDDLQLEEVGLVNVLRRPGAPILVRGEHTGTVYEEGRDYARIVDPSLTFRFDHEGPPIRLLPASRIAHDERLRVSYYHGMVVTKNQVSVCMSEPEVYEIWRKQAQLIHEALAPGRYFLDMDEIRQGGACQACVRRDLSMAEILGDCFTKQFQTLRSLNPNAEIFTWSDMLDPAHNASPDYYLVQGDFTGSWKYVPKELRMVCWWFERGRECLAHFSSQGFRTFAGAYYDTGSLDETKGWLELLDQTPGILGIMYTTWKNDYGQLAPFGELVFRRR